MIFIRNNTSDDNGNDRDGCDGGYIGASRACSRFQCVRLLFFPQKVLQIFLNVERMLKKISAVIVLGIISAVNKMLCFPGLVCSGLAKIK